MSTLRGFSGKRFYAVAQPLDNTGNRNMMTCLVVLMMLCGVIVAIVLYLKPSAYQTAQDAPQATVAPDVASTAIAPTTDQTGATGNTVRNPGAAPCVAVNADCGNVTPVGARVNEGAAGYHKDADGHIRVNPPAGWIAMPDCKSDGLRVWVETNTAGDITGYHCAK